MTEAEASAKPTEPTAKPTEPTAEPTAKPTEPTPTPEPTAKPPEPEKPFSVGVTSNNVYTSALFGIGLALDENWELCTQEELEEMNGVSAGEALGEAFQNAMDNGAVYTDVMAIAEDGLMSISASIEKLSAEDASYVYEEVYVDIAIGSNAFEESFEEMGVPLVALEKGTAFLAGVERPCIYLAGDVEGITLYEKIIPVKAGRYLLIITVCSVGENILDDLIGLFYAA